MKQPIQGLAPFQLPFTNFRIFLSRCLNFQSPSSPSIFNSIHFVYYPDLGQFMPVKVILLLFLMITHYIPIHFLSSSSSSLSFLVFSPSTVLVSHIFHGSLSFQRASVFFDFTHSCDFFWFCFKAYICVNSVNGIHVGGQPLHFPPFLSYSRLILMEETFLQMLDSANTIYGIYT